MQQNGFDTNTAVFARISVQITVVYLLLQNYQIKENRKDGYVVCIEEKFT